MDRAILGLATAQHLVFSLAQLVEAGLAASSVRSRVAVSRLHRVYRAVYSLVPPDLLTREGRWMAAVLACGPGAVLSHRDAADLHGLRCSERAKIDVTVPRRSAPAHRGIDVHRSTLLTPRDVTTLDGIPCTTVTRTMFDLATTLRRRPVERAFDQADAERSLNLRKIDEHIARHPTHPGTATVKAILAEHYIGSSLTASELEEAM